MIKFEYKNVKKVSNTTYNLSHITLFYDQIQKLSK